MNTKKRQIASFLLLFISLMTGRINAQELIKAEKEWLIDYYFKDDTAFANRLAKVAYYQAQAEYNESGKILSMLKLHKSDTIKKFAVAYYNTIQYRSIDDRKAYVFCDSLLRDCRNLKKRCTRFYIEIEFQKLLISSDSFRMKESKGILQLRYLNLMRFARENKDYYGFVNICRQYPWFSNCNSPCPQIFNINYSCLKIADIIDYKRVKFKIYDDLAYFNSYGGNLSQFYKYNFLALKLNDQLNYKIGIVRSYNLYSDQNFTLGDYETAIKYKSKIIYYLAKNNYVSSLCEHLSEYAKFLKYAGQSEKSLKMNNMALRLSNLQNNIFRKIICKNGYYRNTLLDKNILNASDILALNKYFKDTDSLFKIRDKNSEDDKYSITFNYKVNFAKYLQLMGEYKSSLDSAVKLSIIYVGPLVGSDEILYNYKIIYEDYKKLGDYKNANIYLEKYYHHIDSVKNLLKIQNVIRDEIEYEAEKIKKKEELEKSLEKEKALIEASRDKNIQIITRISIVFLIIVLFFGLYFYRQKTKSEKLLSHLNNELYTKNIEIQNTLEYSHKMEKEIMLQKIETQNKESEFQLAQAELKALRSQMNPHFLFNAINSIQSYMLKNDSFLASKYLTKFARLIRSVLENSKQEFVLLSTEISTLELYVELEAMRSSFEFDYEFVLEDGMISSDYLIPPMIIQPYVENAILHGITQLSDRRGNLIVSFSIENQILKCIVDDNGIGRKEAMEIKATKDINRKSIGLEVTNNRIEILNKHNKMFAQVNIIDKFDHESNAVGTRVEIEITLNKAV